MQTLHSVTTVEDATSRIWTRNSGGNRADRLKDHAPVSDPEMKQQSLLIVYGSFNLIKI